VSKSTRQIVRIAPSGSSNARYFCVVKTIIHTLCLLAALGGGTRAYAQSTPGIMTTTEKTFALELLSRSASAVYASTGNLTAAQLAYKPAADRWSVADCLKHLAAAEKELWAMAQGSLSQAPNPEKRSAIRLTDEQLVAAVRDRTQKSKTFAALEPANSPYKTAAEAAAAFSESRGKLIGFVQTTDLDLRNRVLELPVGTYDVYQFILLIAAHSERHLQQIQEVMADPDFPKK
jgi:hypothetical protein